MPVTVSTFSERPRRYFRVHFTMLRVLGLGWWHHPDQHDLNNFPPLYIPYCVISQLLFMVVFVGLETIDPFFGNKDVERFMFGLSFVITHDLTFVKIYLFFVRNRDLQELVRTVEVDMYDHYQNDDKNRKTVRYVRIQAMIYLFFGWMTIANSTINGIIQDLHWKANVRQLGLNETIPERILAQAAYIPWDFQGETSYIVTFFLEVVGLMWNASIVMTIDIVIAAMITHLSAQFETLQEAFETLYVRAMAELSTGIPTAEQEPHYADKGDILEEQVRKIYTEQQIHCVLEKYLHNCIRQHQLLIRHIAIRSLSSPSSGCGCIMMKGLVAITRPKTEKPRAPRRYFYFHYVVLRFFGTGWWHHPDQRDFNNFPRPYIPYSVITQLILVTFVALEALDLYFAERFMFGVGVVITHSLTYVKIYLFIVRNRDIQETVSTIEVEMYDHYQNDEMNRRTVRAVRTLTFSYLIAGWFTLVYSVTNGVIADVQWKRSLKDLDINETTPERIFAQPIHIPWNIQEDRSFTFTYLVESVVLTWFAEMMTLFDVLIAAVIVHLSGQFEILQEAFTSLYERAMTELRSGIPDLESRRSNADVEEEEGNNIALAKYTQNYIERVLEKYLHNCIRQHQVLIRCVEKFGNFYSYAFLAQLLSSSGALCVIMVQVSKDVTTVKSVSFATSVAFFIAMVMQLALQSITSSELTYQAGQVAVAALQCHWEALPPRLRRQLVVVTARAQRPLYITAGGFVVMSNATFLSIIKASYSYYAVLRTKS